MFHLNKRTPAAWLMLGLAALIALGASQRACAEWVDACWGALPSGVRATSSDHGALIAEGEWEQVSVQVFDRATQAHTGSSELDGAITRIRGAQIGVTSVHPGRGEIATQIMDGSGALRVCVVGSDASKAVDLVRWMTRFLEHCDFLEASAATRALTLPATRIAIALPKSMRLAGDKRWLDRGSELGGARCAAHLIEAVPSGWSDLAGFRERVETVLRGQEFSPRAGQVISLDAEHEARARLFQRELISGDGDQKQAVQRFAAAICMQVEGRYFALIAQATESSVLEAIMESVSGSGRLLPRAASGKRSGMLARSSSVESIDALLLEDGRPCVLWLDAAAQPVVWRREQVLLVVIRQQDGAEILQLMLSASDQAGLQGELPSINEQGALTLRVRLPDGRSLECELRRQP